MLALRETRALRTPRASVAFCTARFDGAEELRVFSAFFEKGAPMWAAMLALAEKHVPAPRRILDLGCGLGEPACHFAAKFKVPILATDVAPSMVSWLANKDPCI